MSLFIKNIYLVQLCLILAILYPTSLANLVVEVGTRHSHQTLLQLYSSGIIFQCVAQMHHCDMSAEVPLHDKSLVTMGTSVGFLSCMLATYVFWQRPTLPKSLLAVRTLVPALLEMHCLYVSAEYIWTRESTTTHLTAQFSWLQAEKYQNYRVFSVVSQRHKCVLLSLSQ